MYEVSLLVTKRIFEQNDNIEVNFYQPQSTNFLIDRIWQKLIYQMMSTNQLSSSSKRVSHKNKLSLRKKEKGWGWEHLYWVERKKIDHNDDSRH